jgi:hypothetical protein
MKCLMLEPLEAEVKKSSSLCALFSPNRDRPNGLEPQQYNLWFLVLMAQCTIEVH